MVKVTRGELGYALAESMRQFGYSDFTDEAALEVFDAYVAGKRGDDLPHGIVGMMLEHHIGDLINAAPRIVNLAETP